MAVMSDLHEELPYAESLARDEFDEAAWAPIWARRVARREVERARRRQARVRLAVRFLVALLLVALFVLAWWRLGFDPMGGQR